MLLAALALLGPGSGFAGGRITGPTGLFSFVPPEGWTISMEASSTQSQVRVDRVSDQVFLTVTARPLPKGMTWNTWREMLKESLAKELNQIKFGSLKVCNSSALSAVGASKDKEGGAVEVVAFSRQGIGFVLTMAYPSAGWARFRPVFEDVLTSFVCLAKR